MPQQSSKFSVPKVASTLLAAVTVTATSIIGLPSQAAFPDGFDPISSGCNDATTIAKTSGGSYWYWGKSREIIVELRLSNKCRSNWTKADVPKGTTIYLKGEQGQQYVRYTTQVAGSSYTDMMNWNPPYAACAKLPEGREVCTALIR